MKIMHMRDYSTSSSVMIRAPMSLHATTALYHCAVEVPSTIFNLIFTFTLTSPSHSLPLNSHILKLYINIYCNFRLQISVQNEKIAILSCSCCSCYWLHSKSSIWAGSARLGEKDKIQAWLGLGLNKF